MKYKNVVSTLFALSALLPGIVYAQEENLESQATDTNTRVIMLGTGSPNFRADRAGQAILVVVDKNLYLFDAGPGYMKNLNAFSGEDFMPPDINYDSGSDYSNSTVYGAMNKLFITHLDSDHVLGVDEMLFRPWVMGRDQPVAIVGPHGTQKLVDGLLESYQADIHHRIEGSQPANTTGYKAQVTEIDDLQVVHEDELVTVTAFPVLHGSWQHGEAFGYRIETPDKVVVISGDTRQSESLYDYYRGADILIHEVMSDVGLSRLSQDWQDYMYHAHTSTRQLAEIAEAVNPGLLVMTHPLYFGQSDEQIREEMTGFYDGDFVLAEDLDVYE
ncbi:MBL fold metallo-hydrolase [Halomonas binhaiensis]|uniref:MBL fold metallo-hydrolase n=1 Tax=Halomonas binhaiensis TaxID=2562282 RepID=A0A5C1NAT4_9GAMM|nr:MBL fold metallo-hydrolase [Halomonas binhaiensis]QEM80254.1 MBL fold metallo-hydrolase [Halomonas binhaiensis]